MTKKNTAESLSKALIIAKLADNQKAQDVVVLDVAEHCSFADYFVVATCLSSPQLRGLGHRIQRALREIGHRPMNASGLDSGNWAILDFADVIVHLFTADGRDHYRIEDLWSRADRIDWLEKAESVDLPDTTSDDEPAE